MDAPTVLVVDDERGFLQISRIILQHAGYHPILAESAEEGIISVQKQAPHLIILDDEMDGMSGSEMCHKLKRDQRTKHIPVIMYSANDRLQDDTFVQQIGANAVVRKPAMPAELLTAVEDCLRQKQVGV